MNNPHDNDPYDEHLRHGVSRLSEVGLSDESRARIRAAVSAFARENPVPDGIEPRRFGFPGIESPWAGELLSLQMVTRPALASMLVAVLVGCGVSYAAEVSLPGDPLYWVKTDVSESVADIITVSDVAQVEWDARKVERRLEEALALAAADRLDAASRNQIEEGITRGVSEFSEHVGSVLAEDPAFAVAARAELEATLRAHQEVLEGLGNDVPKKEVEAIVRKAKEHADAVSAERAALIEESALLEATAIAKAEAARLSVEVARRTLTEVHGRRGADSSAEADVSARLALAAEAYAEGDLSAESGDYAAAFASYQESHKFAKEARILAATGRGARAARGDGEDSEDDAPAGPIGGDDSGEVEGEDEDEGKKGSADQKDEEKKDDDSGVQVDVGGEVKVNLP